MTATISNHPPKPETLEHPPQTDDVSQELPKTDTQLLKQFFQDQRQEAFTELVNRHAAMVLGVCRQILRDEHEAEDVFQAAFLILANKGRQIQRGNNTSIAAWLHRVAYRAALRTARAKQKKGKHLVEEVESPDLEQWHSIAKQEEHILLHEELHKLPEIYREALVLCCLEGLSCNEAAQHNSSTPEAMQKRVVRGKQMLQLRLARRGVATSIALLAVGSATCEAATLPSLVSLTSDICTATVLHADPTIYSTNVGHIAQQGVASMNIFTPTTLVASAAILGTPIILLASLAGMTETSNDRRDSSVVLTAAQETDRNPIVLVANQTKEATTEVQPDLDENLRVILHRQKGKTLQIYLNATRAYVNGRSVSESGLKTIVEKSGLKRAEISAETFVSVRKVTAWEKILRDSGIKDIAFTKPAPKETVQEKQLRILANQKGETLKVYLEGTQRIYLNGTQVSKETLTDTIQKSGLDKAVIGASLEVVHSRVVEMEKLLLSKGIKSVEKVGSAAKELTLEELAVAVKDKAKKDRNERLRAIIVGQKGDRLRLYLDYRGAFLNGRSIVVDDIKIIVEASKIDKAVISAEPYLKAEKVTYWQKVLTNAGVENIEFSVPEKK